MGPNCAIPKASSTFVDKFMDMINNLGYLKDLSNSHSRSEPEGLFDEHNLEIIKEKCNKCVQIPKHFCAETGEILKRLQEYEPNKKEIAACAAYAIALTAGLRPAGGLESIQALAAAVGTVGTSACLAHRIHGNPDTQLSKKMVSCTAKCTDFM